MRLNKLLASRLGVSRRAADRLIDDGRVTIAGTKATLGTSITDDAEVLFDNLPLPQATEYIYLLLNKPTSYVCSREGQGSKTIYELLPAEYHHLNPVGRLDIDSSGLLLMTNDGDLHNKMTHPSHEKEKVYEVELDKPLTDIDQKMIQTGGVTLSDGPSKFTITPYFSMRRVRPGAKNQGFVVKMHEGRNRQIRRTLEALGYKVTKLQRTQFGGYEIDGLAPGKYKEISP